MTIILDGKKVRDAIAVDLAQKITLLKVKPKLAIIQVGDLEESGAYIRQKKLFGTKIGSEVFHMQLSSDVSEQDLLLEIKKLNEDKEIHGIIVQMPIPKHLNKELVTESISPEKDVDGLHSKNVKLLWEGKTGGFLPATAKGVLSLLRFYNVPLKGQRVVVVGRSSLVGKPTALALLNENATVTLCHRYTENLSQITRDAVIVIVAVGIPNFIGPSFVKEGQIIIDVGINLVSGEKLEDEIPEHKLVGDVDFEKVSKVVEAISPVPGGVGPMTVASLFENLFLSCVRGNSE